MAVKCKAPVEGHESADTKARCPACNPHAAAPKGIVPAHMSAAPAPAQQMHERVIDILRSEGPVGQGLEAELARIERKVAEAEVRSLTSALREICPSVQSLKWDCDPDQDYEPEKFGMECEHSDGVEDQPAPPHDERALNRVIAAISTSKYMRPDADVITPEGFSHDWDGNPDVPLGILDVFGVHVREKLDINPGNTEAVNALRDMKWWTLDADSPEVALIKRVYPDLASES